VNGSALGAALHRFVDGLFDKLVVDGLAQFVGWFFRYLGRPRPNDPDGSYPRRIWGPGRIFAISERGVALREVQLLRENMMNG